MWRFLLAFFTSFCGYRSHSREKGQHRFLSQQFVASHSNQNRGRQTNLRFLVPKSKSEIQIQKYIKWDFVTKLVLTYWEKNCSSDWEKHLKFEPKSREFAKFLKSLEQFIQTVKGQNNFSVTECFFNLFLEVSQI